MEKNLNPDDKLSGERKQQQILHLLSLFSINNLISSGKLIASIMLSSELSWKFITSFALWRANKQCLK